ncbi:hypothetical protein PEBR_30402 [Penicillium brasilianum]|uniref:Chitin synthesis regulation, Congo red resistance, RCR protein n=1 Tax=Penicillium brasilianum TaxID=104259 RepID=A0A1S9RFV1_PENBI|nr:hypothetical protein PEBR_30402 [Penicillium brasilianum]
MAITPRYWCNSYYDNCSSWDTWGRWVAFGVIVGCAFLIFFAFACFNARRRRNHGLRPYTGTAWMAPPPGNPPNQPGYQQPYGNDPYYSQQPPPQYSANPQNYGYFGAQHAPGQQQTGIELQQPAHAHGAGANQYAPPPGPPPAKA